MDPGDQDVFLAFMECQCTGVKFYNLPTEIRYGEKVQLKKIDNYHDPNCIGVYIKQNDLTLQIGHIAAEDAKLLCSLLNYYRITWYVSQLRERLRYNFSLQALL